jgi:choline dehydrogenase-like flavoprotein
MGMDTFDFIVVGGGSGGCAVASRLSEDPATSVALLEAGGKDDNWVVTTPGALILMVAGKVNNWAFDTVPQAGLNGRVGYQPRGKGLGGSSAINAMVYTRGHRRDYDQWASLGNSGWSYADVLPYFNRSEDNSELDGEYHGKGGPLHVTGLRTDNPVREIYLQAAREAQFRIREDFNAEEQEGLGAYQVTQRNGERWSAARGYIHPFMASRANLRVETHAHATRILFEGKRAVGVEYRQGKEIRQIRARREVIRARSYCCFRASAAAPHWPGMALQPRTICPASDRTCRIIRTLFSALPRTRRISPACRSVASHESSRASPNTDASGAGR